MKQLKEQTVYIEAPDDELHPTHYLYAQDDWEMFPLFDLIKKENQYILTKHEK